MFRKIFLVALTLLSCQLAHAQGGPPMVTDDPGTPGNNRWEINVASILSTSYNQRVIQAPYFDINYGLGDHIQLKLETGWVVSKGIDTHAHTGADTTLLGVKYRFLDEETSGVSISTYPQFQFHHFFSSHDPEIASPGNQYILPLEFSKTFGIWQINPEVGFLHGTQVDDEIFYGLLFALESVKPFEPLAELHANSHLNGNGTVLLINFGARYTLNTHVNLIASAGHTVTHTLNSSTEFDSYLGVQLEL